jgi:hypothetical protein
LSSSSWANSLLLIFNVELFVAACFIDCS